VAGRSGGGEDQAAAEEEAATAAGGAAEEAEEVLEVFQAAEEVMYPYTLAASSSSLASWPFISQGLDALNLVTLSAKPDCMLIVYRCTRTHPNTLAVASSLELHRRRVGPWPAAASGAAAAAAAVVYRYTMSKQCGDAVQGPGGAAAAVYRCTMSKRCGDAVQCPGGGGSGVQVHYEQTVKALPPPLPRLQVSAPPAVCPGLGPD